MRFAVGVGLIIAGVLVTVLQVRWAARASAQPLRLGYFDRELPPRTRIITNVLVINTIVVGAILISPDDPWWVRWLVFAAGFAVTVAVQALTIRLLRPVEPADR